MIKKTIYGIAAIFMLAAAVLSFSNQSVAKNENDYILPETEGVYDVPGKPNMKLRVFVYHAKDEDADKEAKQGKPIPQPPVEVCGKADPESSSVVSGAGWVLPSSWTYNVNIDSVPQTIGATNAQTLIANAYNTWTDVVGSKISFTQGSETFATGARYDGQNIVAWGRTSGTALAVTYTWYNAGVAVEIDTIMNKKFTWYWSNPDSWTAGQTCAYSGVYDAQNILTHELGHTVGLDDEYDGTFYGNATMYGYGSKGETKKDTLTTGDILGARSIYGL